MFREDKTTQMAARFLALADGRISYLKLLKLLYLADKQMLIDHGKPITYDRWYAMKHGPVLSSTYNLIKSTAPSEYWANYIHTEKYDVVLSDDPGTDALSTAEDRIIDTVFKKYQDHDGWQMVHIVQPLSEWEDPGDTSREMTYGDVLRVEGFDAEDIENILDNIRLSPLSFSCNATIE